VQGLMVEDEELPQLMVETHINAARETVDNSNKHFRNIRVLLVGHIKVYAVIPAV
jgi:hypothetical protein